MQLCTVLQLQPRNPRTLPRFNKVDTLCKIFILPIKTFEDECFMLILPHPRLQRTQKTFLVSVGEPMIFQYFHLRITSQQFLCYWSKHLPHTLANLWPQGSNKKGNLQDILSLLDTDHVNLDSWTKSNDIPMKKILRYYCIERWYLPWRPFCWWETPSHWRSTMSLESQLALLQFSQREEIYNDYHRSWGMSLVLGLITNTFLLISLSGEKMSGIIIEDERVRVDWKSKFINSFKKLKILSKQRGALWGWYKSLGMQDTSLGPT